MPQREITACLFHSERKQKSEEMGPPRDMGSRGLSGPSPKGVWRWITSRGRNRALGLLSSSRSGFLVRGSAFSKALLPTTAVSRYTATHYKNTSAGNPGIDKGPDGNGGWVQNYLRVGCGLDPTSRQSKPPVFHGSPSGPWSPEGPEGNTGSGELGL